MTSAVNPELGRKEGRSEGFSSQAVDTFPFRVLASGEIRSGTQVSSTGKLAKRKKKIKKLGDMSKGRIQPQAGQKYHAVPK